MPLHARCRYRHVALVWLLSAACDKGDPDLILYNGRIVTLDGEQIVEAVAIRDGLISAVGTTELVRDLAGDDTRSADLGGRTVIPGLADNHYHGIGGGAGVDLSDARTMSDVIRRIANRAAETPPGQIVTTNSNWHEGQLAEQRLPLRDDLDRATTDHPVVVVRGGHEYILNSHALSRWNINREAPDPDGGRIGRYPDGRLNGELVDRATSLVTLPPPERPDPEQRLADLAAEHAVLNAHGLTTIRCAGASPALYRQLLELKNRNQLTVRVRLLFRLSGRLTADQVDSALATLPAAQDEGDEWLRVDGIKLGVDGGFEGGLMREPYEEPWGRDGEYAGLQTVPADRYQGVVRALNRSGWRVATHAVGDAAIDLVLDAYELAHAERPITDRRFVIEHGFIPRQEHFERMRTLGLVVSAQHHLYLAAPSLVAYWGADRAAWTTPIRAYREAGIPVSSGTDSPVVGFQPFHTFYHFSTRGTITAGQLDPSQAVDRLDALRLATEDNAFLAFDEGKRGRISPGMQADLAVLDRDILRVPDHRLEDTEVVMTIIGGRVVYQSGS